MEHASKPVGKKYVRAIMHHGSVKLTPVEGGKFDVVSINLVDIDFNPPKMMVSKMTEKRLTMLNKIQEKVSKK